MQELQDWEKTLTDKMKADQQSLANLQRSVSYGVTQNPDDYAKQLALQQQTGVPPQAQEATGAVVSQAAQTNQINYNQMLNNAPQTSAWASNPDNAAVAGVDEVQRMARIEQHFGSMSAYTPTLWDKVSDWASDATKTMTGSTPAELKQSLFEGPLTRGAIDIMGGASGMVGDVGSMFGWHGSGGNKSNLLQRVESSLSPEANLPEGNLYAKENGFDWLAKNVAPLAPMMATGVGEEYLLGKAAMSPAAVRVLGILAKLTPGAVFTAQQGGQTYTQLADAGASDYQARLAANRTALLNAPLNVLMGFTDAIPGLRDNPFLASTGLGALQGATGQIGQNEFVTDKPWYTDVAKSTLQAAAMQAGMHIGMGYLGSFGGAIDEAQASALRERAPDAFQQVTSRIADGAASVRVPAGAFNEYFRGKDMDPAAVASDLGSTNYAEAVLSGGDVELRPEDYLAKLAPEHQNGLFRDIVDPASGVSINQYEQGKEELAQFVKEGGMAKLLEDAKATDAETQASPEWQSVKEELRQRYVNAGENEAVAEGKAALDANVYSNLARESGMKPTELLNLTNPKVVEGEAPEVDDYPAAKDFDAIAGSLPSNARGDGGNDGIVIHGPGADESESESQVKTDEPVTLYQAAPADNGKPPASAGAPVPMPDGSRGAMLSNGVRGWMRKLADGSFEIGRTKISDFSTMVHETGHMYLDMIRELVKRPAASERLKDDYAKILDFLGAKDGEPLTREQQEKWARANEQYLRERKVDVDGLRGVFHRFAVWLHGVYRGANDLGVELDPETRGVMDRLYGSEASVDRAQREAGPKLFNNAEEAGWTDEEYQKYAESNGVSADQAKAHVQKEMSDAAEREQSTDRKEEQRTVRQAVTEQLDASREYTAIRSLRRGAMDDGTELTLNRDELAKQFGEERVKALQDQHRGLYRREGGTDAESAAEILGYHSADEMMRALTETPRRNAAIEQGTRDYLVNKYGDVRYDGTLNDRARFAVENNERAGNIYRELRALKQKMATMEQRNAEQQAAMKSITIAPIEAYQEAARQMIDRKAPADLQPSRYLDASRKYSREAFDALRKGNAGKAADAKHKELLNHFLFREASEARDYVEKFEKYVKQSVQSKGIQQRLGLAGSDYRQQYNWLLARYQLGPKPMEGAPERSLRAWAEDVYSQGKEPAVTPAIMDDGQLKNYRNVPLAEIRDLHDALLNIRALASQEFKIFVQGKQVEFAEAKNAMIDSARTNLKSKPEKVFEENRSLADRALDPLRYVDARLIRMERLIEWLDGGKEGPWHDNVWNLAADAQGDEYKLQEGVTKQVMDALSDMPAEMRRRLWTEKVNVEGIPEAISRRRLLSMAFNMGNEGNLDRLRKTFTSLGWDPEAVGRIGQMLSREEWQFVQKAWDSLKPLGVRMNELEKRLTGLAPAMVKVTPLKLRLLDSGADIELDGGYFPIVMDPKYSQRAVEQDAKETAQNAMQAGYVRATTSRGYTKERTGFGGPLLLDYEQALTSHVAKVAKDLSHREFMLSTQRLLLDTEVRKTLRETLGPKYEQQFMPWLRTIINDNNGSTQERLDTLKEGMQTLRGNIVAASLGFNFSTSLLQVSHAPRMLLYAKPASLAQAFLDMLSRPRESAQEIRGLSPNEMRFRSDNLDRDVRAVLQKPEYNGGYTRKVAVAARFALEMMDHLLSHTLWRAAYNDALTKHTDLSESDAQAKAVYEADSAVRLGLGSSAPKDLPAIMRGNEFNKFVTTLYGFHSGVYNQLRDIGHQFRTDRKIGKLTYAGILTAIVPAVVGAWLTGHGPKDDENSGWWAAKRSLSFAADTVPFLRAIASAVEGGHDVQFSPIENVMTKGAKDITEATSDKENKDWMGIGLDAAQTAGEVMGVPGTNQVAKILHYVHRANQGKIQNPSVWGALVGGR